MPMRASRQPSPKCYTPHGNAAACTSCATCLLMPVARAVAWSQRLSVRPSSRMTPRQRANSGARSPISCVPKSEARRLHGRGRSGCPRLHELPERSSAEIHSTNPLERLNGEIKRRTDVVGIFPDEDAIIRLVGALLLEQNDEWAVQRGRYMSLETIAPLSDDPIIKLPAVAAA